MPHIKIPHGIRQRLRTRLNKDEYFKAAKYKIRQDRRRSIEMMPKSRHRDEFQDNLTRVLGHPVVFMGLPVTVRGLLSEKDM